MSAAWFVDGEYLGKVWQGLNRPDQLDYVKLRQHLEATYCDAGARERIEDAYYFNADQARRPPGRTRTTTRWRIRRPGALACG